jgi:GNAT superfamily N-acetyltransferase
VQPRIELLSPDSPLIDAVVGWHWREWSHEYDDANLDEWRRRVRDRTHPDRVPFTMVAHLDDEPVGCLSVCEDDLDSRFTDCGPWLSGTVVIGSARNLGVGRALVQAVEEYARMFGVAELWLRTGQAGPFYERCGWTYMVRKAHVRDDAVMRRGL